MSTLTSRQFGEWIAYYKRNPFGQDVTEQVQAKVGATLWNQKRGKGVDPIEPEVFLPKQRPQQTAEEMKLTLRRFLPSGNR